MRLSFGTLAPEPFESLSEEQDGLPRPSFFLRAFFGLTDRVDILELDSTLLFRRDGGDRLGDGERDFTRGVTDLE